MWVASLRCRPMGVDGSCMKEFCFCESTSWSLFFKSPKKTDKRIVAAKELLVLFRVYVSKA